MEYAMVYIRFVVMIEAELRAEWCKEVVVNETRVSSVVDYPVVPVFEIHEECGWRTTALNRTKTTYIYIVNNVTANR
jgi:hypothetical protein